MPCFGAPNLRHCCPAVRECLSALSALRHLGHVELVQADNGPLMVLRHTAALPAGDREKLERFSQTHGLSLYLAPQSEILEHIHGEAPWYTSDGLRLVFSPRDFIQVNDGVNQQMVRTALEWLDLQPEDRVLDLFCGMGNFTLPLATRAAQVVGVEGVPALVEKGAGKRRPQLVYQMSLSSMKIWKRMSPVQAWAKHGFDKVLLDPARAGAPGVMPHIIKLAPRRVVYVSCNPADAGARQRNPCCRLDIRFNAWRCWICSRIPVIWNQWCCLSAGLHKVIHNVAEEPPWPSMLTRPAG
ncbi:23S rRNA 5-methyluridine methyltransferase [Klebsiella variicola]|uniref:23S rRNA 5-methyluridine methyltransferase n=1 Tax=Klebsiella variicola TaxID=244366 RepID=A0A7H4MRC7_KLEVA|nr:23S rRNA 5-methyluridine methyltransferase [Klebsiella variicola]